MRTHIYFTSPTKDTTTVTVNLHDEPEENDPFAVVEIRQGDRTHAVFVPLKAWLSRCETSIALQQANRAARDDNR